MTAMAITEDVVPGSVSVVMATYNAEATLERAVDSLMTQSHRPLEMVLIDDGSTDRTPEVIEALRERHGARLHTLHQPNAGFPAAINVAIAQCRGEFVVIADDDDEYAPDRINSSVALMERSGADMVGGQVVGRFDSGPRFLRFAPSRFPIEPDEIAKRVARGHDPLPHITLMMRRSSIERFGLYRPVPRAADLELMLRWVRRGAAVAVSPEVFAIYTFRREFFNVVRQTQWMHRAEYGRYVAALDDDEDHDIEDFSVWSARHPARRAVGTGVICVIRLTGRLVVGTLRLR